MIDRRQALEILHEFVQSPSLRRHALQVEACVAAYGAKYGEDVETWSVTALLHDFDFEIHPTLDKHPVHGEPILAARGVPDEVRRAILSHADYSGVPRLSLLEKALFACDELSGFISATALVRPSRSVADVDAGSVKRKMKDKAFARAVRREDIIKGAEELGIPLDEHIEFCVRAMQARAVELGLAG
jgi:putative nucleotidyltransferase with HDIG domain